MGAMFHFAELVLITEKLQHDYSEYAIMDNRLLCATGCKLNKFLTIIKKIH
jgi:hypothetical protein